MNVNVELTNHCFTDDTVFVVSIVPVPANKFGKSRLPESLSEHSEYCQVILLASIAKLNKFRHARTIRAREQYSSRVLQR